MRIIAIAASIAALALAADSGFHYWGASALKGYDKKLAPKVNSQKVATENLGTFGNSNVMVAHRQADGEAELHETFDDYFVAQTGQATLVYGGSVVDGKTTAPHEIRGASIKGGSRQELAPGDVAHIPAGMPHQVLVPKGKQFTYFVIKVKK